jgi:hypothetical protein
MQQCINHLKLVVKKPQTIVISVRAQGADMPPCMMCLAAARMARIGWRATAALGGEGNCNACGTHRASDRDWWRNEVVIKFLGLCIHIFYSFLSTRLGDYNGIKAAA